MISPLLNVNNYYSTYKANIKTNEKGFSPIIISHVN